jgi:uncharacterized protein
VRRWREGLLAAAMLSLGAGVLVSALLRAGSAEGALVADAAAWIAMLAPVVWAFTRSRPAGLLRFRVVDLLWGVGLAVLLRIAQGSVSVALGGTGALPVSAVEGGGADAGAPAIVGAVLVAPTVTELFFRAVVLVALFSALRRGLGALPAGIVAVVVSAAASAVVAAMTAGFTPDRLASALLLGLVCGVLVALTGRIWGAVLVHVLYAASLVALAGAGALLG